MEFAKEIELRIKKVNLLSYDIFKNIIALKCIRTHRLAKALERSGFNEADEIDSVNNKKAIEEIMKDSKFSDLYTKREVYWNIQKMIITGPGYLQRFITMVCFFFFLIFFSRSSIYLFFILFYKNRKWKIMQQW